MKQIAYRFKGVGSRHFGLKMWGGAWVTIWIRHLIGVFVVVVFFLVNAFLLYVGGQFSFLFLAEFKGAQTHDSCEIVFTDKRV